MNMKKQRGVGITRGGEREAEVIRKAANEERTRDEKLPRSSEVDRSCLSQWLSSPSFSYLLKVGKKVSGNYQ